MADFRIIDETKDEVIELTEEELKELARQENLKKLTKKRKTAPTSVVIIIKIIIIDFQCLGSNSRHNQKSPQYKNIVLYIFFCIKFIFFYA